MVGTRRCTHSTGVPPLIQHAMGCGVLHVANDRIVQTNDTPRFRTRGSESFVCVVERNVITQYKEGDAPRVRLSSLLVEKSRSVGIMSDPFHRQTLRTSRHCSHSIQHTILVVLGKTLGKQAQTTSVLVTSNTYQLFQVPVHPSEEQCLSRNISLCAYVQGVHNGNSLGSLVLNPRV